MKNYFTYLIFGFSILVSVNGHAQTSSKSEFTYLNKEALFSIIDKSTNDYHLIYSYGNWCRECKETFPKLTDLISNYINLDFYPLIVDKPNKEYLNQNIETIRKNFNYHGKLYVTDLFYGKRYYHQYKNFIVDIAPEHSEYGMSLIMLFNKNGEMLYATTYHQSTEEKINGLIKVLENN